jgi:ribosomal protein L11 methyltransferase
MTWLELSVDVEPEAVESISELLAQHGYNGGVVIDQPIITGADGPEYTYDTSRPVTLRTYIPLDAQAEEIRQRLEQALWHFGQMRAVGPLSARPLEEEDWANAWKQHYTIQRIGQRTVIVPSWLEYQPEPDDIVLRLDPGMAFGTGLHPTTRLCMRALEDYVKPEMHRILDLGTGSAILAIGAAHLGGPDLHVWALDVDPVAVDVAAENVARNGLSDRITVAAGSLDVGEVPPRRYALIVANILARVIIALAPALYDALEPGGVLIASGIIAERGDEVDAALRAAGLRLLEHRSEGDWLAVVGMRDEA